MATTTENTILLQANGVEDLPVYDDALAGGTITPGMLITWSSGTLIANASAADADAEILFAVENPYLDPTVDTSPAIDTTYASGKVVRYIRPPRGVRLNALLETGNNVARGAALESNGAGALQAFSTGRIVAFADEAVNNSSGSNVRIKVRVA